MGPESLFDRAGSLPAWRALFEGETAPVTASRRDAAWSPAVCNDLQARRLLLPYALSRCDEADGVDFEVHLLACPVCFADLKSLDRAGSLLRDLLALPTAACDRVRLGLRSAPAPRPDESDFSLDLPLS